jgi:hypothetical protein
MGDAHEALGKWGKAKRGSFMVDFASHVLQYAVYSLEIGVAIALVCRGYGRRLAGVFVYLVLLVGVDAVGRPLVLHRYGFDSNQYTYFYWLTNALLLLAALLLVCAFFRSAFAREKKWWDILKLALPLVFVLVVAISLFSIWRNYKEVPTAKFISEFGQYLYFTCLVLNTLLFIMMQYVETADDVLPMLVCGLGLQFAGPAATMALLTLAPHNPLAVALMRNLEPVCTLAMLSVWLYAVNRGPITVRRTVREGRAAVPQQVAA